MRGRTSKEARKGFPSKADVMARTPDPAVRQMLVRMETLGIETAFDRFDAPRRRPTADSDSMAPAAASATWVRAR
jgi:hypothetical protein